MTAAARARSGPDRRLSRPPRARLPVRLHALAGAVAQAARRQERGPRAVGRAAPDRRARARDRSLPCRRNTGRSSREMEHDGTEFDARLVTFDGEKLERLTHRRRGHRDARQGGGRGGRASRVEDVETKPLKRNPAPPFTTSTLQQEAARKLGFSASHTMRVAQIALRGGRDHLHADRRRADGPQRDFRLRARRSPIATTGTTCPKSRASTRPRPRTRRKRTRRSARPTSPATAPVRATRRKLYDLIFKRAMASQMAAASLERTTVTLREPHRPARTARHRAGGEVPRLPGGLRGRPRPDSGDDEDEQPAADDAQGRHARPRRRRGRAALHPAAAALFRSEPGQAAGGTRHRPAFDLCLDDPDAARPRLCADGEEPLLRRGIGPAADRVPRTLLPALRRLRFHRRDGGRARRRLRRAGRLEGAARGVLARLQAQERRGDGAASPRK